MVLIRHNIQEEIKFMDDKRKKFLTPNAEVVDFSNEDIITLSGATETANWYESQSNGDNQENFQ